MYWHWLKGGLALGLCFLLAVAMVKPIGVSTQFVIFDGIVVSQFDKGLVINSESSKSGYESTNAYLNKSGGKYAAAIAEPFNYSFLFVLSMLLGGFLGQRLQQSRHPDAVPQFHNERFGSSPGKRYVLAFIGGIIVLWGARLAGGCTSGHMMSGMMQTALSGYMFALATFLVAVPTAIVIYRK